ncbi:MAG: hypothetical protein WB709_07295 [Solirubrobacteraceae bacterium]
MSSGSLVKSGKDARSVAYYVRVTQPFGLCAPDRRAHLISDR